VEICRRLDGLPLAIELAAARVRSMAPADLLKRLDNRLELLRGGAGAAERQATGRAAVAWSYQLLADRGQLLFDRLSVFAGGFDLDAAEAVCADDGLSGSEVFDLLSGLVDKSMVMTDRELGGARYRLLETMRLFGHENLVAAGDLDRVRARHLLHFRLLAERTDRSFRGASQTIGAIVFGREWDNLRVAHQWAVHTHDIDSAERLLGATRLFAESLNRVEQGEWAERILAIGTEQRPPQPDIYAQAAYWAFMDENSERYFDLLDRGIELLSSLDDADATLCLAFAVPNEHPRAPHPYEHFEIAASKLDLAVEWWALLALEENGAIFNYPNASHYRARVVEMAAQVQAPTLMVAADLLTGHELIVASDRDAAGALECYRSALRIAQLSGDAMSEASCLRAIALATTLAEPSRAIEACRDALVAVYDIRQWIRIWQLFESIAMCCVRLERLEAVAVIVGYLKSHWEPSGLEEQLGFRAFTRNALDAHPELQSSLKRGAAMNRYEIVGFALTELQQMLDAAST
jgi:hypothetical protein